MKCMMLMREMPVGTARQRCNGKPLFVGNDSLYATPTCPDGNECSEETCQGLSMGRVIPSTSIFEVDIDIVKARFESIDIRAIYRDSQATRTYSVICHIILTRIDGTVPEFVLLSIPRRGRILRPSQWHGAFPRKETTLKILPQYNVPQDTMYTTKTAPPQPQKHQKPQKRNQPSKQALQHPIPSTPKHLHKPQILQPKYILPTPITSKHFHITHKISHTHTATRSQYLKKKRSAPFLLLPAFPQINRFSLY